MKRYNLSREERIKIEALKQAMAYKSMTQQYGTADSLVAVATTFETYIKG